jgi:hypothetical protein
MSNFINDTGEAGTVHEGFPAGIDGGITCPHAFIAGVKAFDF